jgi:hypothetical protein
MRIFTYYVPIAGFDQTNEELLIELWKKSWAQHGYTPVVLGPADAAKHPRFAEFNARMEQLPTINGYAYEGACYHRWLAVQHALGDEPGIMSDYDVMCYEPLKTPKADVTIFSLVGLETHNDDEGLERLKQSPGAPADAIFAWVVPCLVHGTAAGFAKIIEAFMNHQASSFDWIFNRRPHTSDQFILTQLRYSGLFQESFQCAEAYRGAWDTYPAVHYPNGVMHPKNMMPRHSHIIALRRFFKEPNRLDIPRLAQTGTIVEVGVAGGMFTAYLADNYKGRVVGVDPYRTFPSEEWKDCINSSNESLEGLYQHALRTIASYPNASIIRKTSLEAAPMFTEGSLEAVFIDGNHMYAAAKADIKAWWSKVRKGGFLCGHDYTAEDEIVTAHVTIGVGKAVREFCKENGLQHTFGYGPDGMWVIQK